MKWLLIALMTAIGAILPAQAGANAEFRRFAGHPLWAALLNFAVGFSALAIVAGVLRIEVPAVERVSQAPWWAWLGGLCGASLVFSAVIAAPRLGATLLVGCLVAGQLASSVIIDHFGWVGYPMREVSLSRVAGVVLLLIGVFLIERG